MWWWWGRGAGGLQPLPKSLHRLAYLGGEGARVPHPARPVVPSLLRAPSISLARSLHGMAQIKCGSLHPVKLPPPPVRWVLTWQLSCSQGKKRRVRDSEAAEPEEHSKASAAELDFRLTYGFSEYRRPKGFCSENQQVRSHTASSGRFGIGLSLRSAYELLVAPHKGGSPVLTAGRYSTVEQAATCCEWQCFRLVHSALHNKKTAWRITNKFVKEISLTSGNRGCHVINHDAAPLFYLFIYLFCTNNGVVKQ